LRGTTLLRSALPLALAAAVLVALGGVHEESHRALAVATWMVSAWLVSPLHPALVGLVGCFLCWATGAVEIESAFGGFGQPMPWAIYGLLILAAASRHSGLDARLGRLLPRAPGAATGTTIALALALSFLVPSAIGKAFVIALVALGAGLPAPLLAAGVYVATALERDLLPPPASLAAWAILVCAAGAIVAVRLRRAEAPAGDTDRASTIVGANLALEWKAALLVGATILAWATTSWHAVPPTMVGLAAGLVACLPILGPLAPSKALSPDPLALILAGTALSLLVVLAKSGAVALIVAAAAATAHALAGVLPPAVATYWTGVVYHLFVPDPRAADALAAIAQATGLDPAAAARAWGSSAATRFALYQSPAFVFAASVGPLRPKHLLLLGAATLALGTLVVLAA